MIKKSIFLLFIVFNITTSAKTYYVAVWGIDSNSGTIDAPWETWQKAFETAVAGDTVFFRGGTWTPDSVVDKGTVVYINPRAGIGHNGSPNNRIHYLNYPNETPILDCKNLIAPLPGPHSDENRYLTAIDLINVHWLHIRGLTIRNLYQVEPYVRPQAIHGWPISNMIFENITVHNIGAEGWYMHASVNTMGQNFGWGEWGYIPYDTTRYINCDTYQCVDSLPVNTGNEPGNMGDGFKHINIDGYITFENCRAWNCIDDGFDMPGSGVTNFINCWSFSNGIEDGMPSQLEGAEGNGFKAGASHEDHFIPIRTFVNCIAAYNKSCGIFIVEYGEAIRTRPRIYNTTIYKNSSGITISKATNYNDSQGIIRNTLSYGNSQDDADIQSTTTFSNSNLKSWNGVTMKWEYNPNITVSDDDFVATSYQSAISQLTASRKKDFSLPDVSFMALKDGSDLIDAGTQIPASDNSGVVLSFYGSAPDIGYSEFISGSVVIPSPIFLGATIEDSTPARLEMSYDLSLANIKPATSAFSVKVNSSFKTINSVTISGSKIFLTLANPVKYGETVTVTYTKPTTNPLQSTQGGQAASITGKTVTNNCISVTNKPPEVMIVSPAKDRENKKNDNITIEITATDPDGTIEHVELRNGEITIAEFTEPPYLFVWHSVDTGTYYISALATDNMGATSVSPVIEIKVGYDYKAMSDMINLYPNPSDGRFTMEMDPLLTEQQVNRIAIVNISGKTIYKEVISGLENTKSFDLSGIDIGIYIILLTNEKAIVATKKFIKQ